MDADRMLKEIGEEVQNVSNLLSEIENSLKKVSNALLSFLPFLLVAVFSVFILLPCDIYLPPLFLYIFFIY